MSGGRIDSCDLRLKFLFDELDTGWAFVRSAAAPAGTAGATRALEFAQQTHDAIIKLAEKVGLTDDERARLRQGLMALQAAIRAVARSPEPVRRG